MKSLMLHVVTFEIVTRELRVARAAATTYLGGARGCC